MLTYTALYQSLQEEFEEKLNRPLHEKEKELICFMAKSHFQHLFTRNSEDLYLEQL